MLSLVQTALASFAGLIVLALWKIWPMLSRAYTSPLRNLPGPPSPSWIYGNIKAIQDEDNSVPQERWAAEYGPVISYKGFFGLSRLWTTDTRALNHILTHSTDYQKSEAARRNVAKILGKGVLFTEGDQHRQQRRIMNPAFGPAQIRELTPIFVEKAAELRDVWDAQLAADGSPTRIEVLSGLSKMTLDVIGLAGFNYNFNSLSGKPNELNAAFQEVLNPGANFTIFTFLKNVFPALDIFPDERAKRLDHAQDVMRRIGLQLIEEKKAQIAREMSEGKSGGVERKDIQGRDLLTLLMKANMATDIPENQRLSHEDVLAQVPTFLLAGHETTSTATMWCLYALTQAPDVQKKLRDELFTLQTEAPTMDELNGLPYLDAVVRETLRIHAPVPTTMRVATKDDVIPISEPFVDRHGKVQDSIHISKGSPIIIPVLSLNRSTELWGADALEFKPERWIDPPETISGIPGVWGHILSFLGGPRACIGYRFSLVEMKALLFELVRAFEFELAVPASDIQKKTSIVQRPLLRSAPEQGSQMPLLVRRFKRAQ
ncbi:cytochrome P450 [Trametes versicolor FP-101664 SS1]|uniref:cytochrome P450 n=1 Tax=Trametes versicolor (strain FP-101664) TaxID=717944 RepID=UPI0004623BC2|nr:cytochrome P450 [Trametes versicolor FP-101664 SS1]EIW53608.1 cytochrome P450 [Trametes versicolor FP-101664 SS1]